MAKSKHYVIQDCVECIDASKACDVTVEILEREAV